MVVAGKCGHLVLPYSGAWPFQWLALHENYDQRISYILHTEEVASPHKSSTVSLGDFGRQNVSPELPQNMASGK